MRRPHLFAAVLAGTVMVPATASAAPCATRATEAVAIVDGVRASCTLPAAQHAMFRWLPAVAGPAVVELEGTSFDAVLDVHRPGHDGAVGERLASWDQGDPRAAEHVAFAADGDPVLLVVRGYQTTDTGTVSVLVRRGAPPNATPEGAQSVPLGADGQGAAGMSWGLPSPAGVADAWPARWFRFVAARSGRMTASTCTPYAGDTALASYAVGTGDGLELLSSNDDTALACARPHASYTGFPVVGGREYRVAVRPGAGLGEGPETLALGWDDNAPATWLHVGPAGVVAERSAAFRWSSPASDAVAFECSLDGDAFTRCAEVYSGLGDGEHAFRVRALDAAGNVGPAAERAWRVASQVVATSASSRPRRVVVETRRVTGARSARARGLALAFDGGVRARFAAGRTATRVLLLALPAPRPGTVVEVRCARRGNGCPFTTRTVRGGTDLATLFRGRRLSVGAVVELRVTRPGTVGRLLRWEVRSSARPRTTALCLPPGTSRAAPC